MLFCLEFKLFLGSIYAKIYMKLRYFVWWRSFEGGGTPCPHWIKIPDDCGICSLGIKWYSSLMWLHLKYISKQPTFFPKNFCLGNHYSQYFNMYNIKAGKSSWFDHVVFGAEYSLPTFSRKESQCTRAQLLRFNR